MKIRKKVILFLIPILIISCFVFIDFNKNINISIEYKKYATPVNLAFTDDNFYKCVIDAYNEENDTDLSYDVSLTDEQLSNIETLNCSLFYSADDNLKIKDLFGIDKLFNLKDLNLSNNLLTAIDLSKNINLEHLDLHNNQLTVIDLRKNINLIDLKVSYNQLAIIDLSRNVDLKSLDLHNNQLKTIDLSKNIDLENLVLYNNQLKTIDLSKNINLINLDLSKRNLDSPSNQLTAIDLSNNINLKYLDLDNNQLSSLDISKNIYLEELSLTDNQVMSLDLSNNNNLNALYVGGNQLDSLNLQFNVNLEYLYADRNNLSDLNIDYNVDLKTLFLTGNNLRELNLKNNVNLNKLDLGYWCTSYAGYANCNNLSQNNQISDLNLSNNENLKEIYVPNNNITSIDVSHNINLKILNVSNNNITSIDVSKNINLEELDVSGNYNCADGKCIALSELDITNNLNLRDLNISNNVFSNIDVSNNTSLQFLNVEKNKLSNLDLSNNTSLILAWLGGNEIRNIECNSISCPLVLYDVVWGGQKKIYYVYKNDFTKINDNELLSLVEQNGYDKDKYVIEYSYFGKDNIEEFYNFEYNIYRASITSSSYFIDEKDNYIYTGIDTNTSDINKNIDLLYNDSSALVTKFTSIIENNRYKIQNAYYSGNTTFLTTDIQVVKEFDIVNISSDKYDLSKPYIFNEDGVGGIYADIIVGNIKCLNCESEVDTENSVIQVKHGEDILQEFDVVNYTSDKYDLSNDFIQVNDRDISSFINNFECTNCNVKVYDGNNYLDSGEFGENYKLVFMYEDEVLKEYDLKYSIMSLDIIEDNLRLNLNGYQTFKLSIEIYPSFVEDKTIFWTSSDQSVVTVDDEGLVTAKGIGKAVITATSIDGVTDICSVEVSDIVLYNVTYEDGNNTYIEQYEEGESIVFKSDLNKAGYKLIGWNYNGNNYKLTDNLVMPDNDIELIARWELIIPEVKNYEINKNNINGISLKTDINNINLGIDYIYDVKVYNYDNVFKTVGLIGTGDKVKIYLDNTLISEYDIIVKGDITGDGDSKVNDVAKLYQYLKGKITMDDCYIYAGNVVNNDEEIKINDVAKLYQFIKGKINNL